MGTDFYRVFQGSSHFYVDNTYKAIWCHSLKARGLKNFITLKYVTLK